MNPFSCGNSINSSNKSSKKSSNKSSNASDIASHYKPIHYTYQKPSKEETFKQPKRSPETCSIESGSQRANTHREEPISLEENILSRQDLATHISLDGYYRCGHVKPKECPCCTAAAGENYKISPKKGQERIKKKAEELTKVVFANSESFKELKEKLTDTTDETKSTIIEFFEAKQKELKEMMDRLVGDMENKKAMLLESVKFEQPIEAAEKSIKVLEGEFEDIDELKLAFNEADDIKNKVLEKNQVIQELGDSLVKRADTKDFKRDLERVVKINQVAFEALQIPGFVDPERSQRFSNLGSTMTPISSFYCSVVSSKPVNFGEN